VIVDTSAIIAVLRREDDAEPIARALAAAPRVAVSAGTLVEIGIVAEGRGGAKAREAAEELLERAEVVPVSPRQAMLAVAGWRRFGKGRHPAGLNFGDCFAYALAMERGEPLLFKGEDFAQTDVKRAI
jgi:ribonuclease VapC